MLDSIKQINLLFLANENNDMTTNTIYLDHCYYKDCPPNTPDANICSPQITLSNGIQNITSNYYNS